MAAIFIILIILGLFAGIFLVIGSMLSKPGYDGPITPHFNGRQFFNETGIRVKGFRELLRWRRSRKPGKWIYRAPKLLPPPPARVSTGLRITFVNHSSFLIQLEGLNIITDPVWSERASPLSWMGPRRMQPPGFKLAELPHVDLVLLSHNHYDHLDIETLRIISKRDHPLFLVPLGVGGVLQEEKMDKQMELDWWGEDQRMKPLTITSVPAQHFSARGMFDRNKTLWCGYIMQIGNMKIYFAGDTGYNPYSFKEIGERFGPIDIAMIPIGAYQPEWFMSPIHCSPLEAVEIHKEVRSKKSIACHFGTFPLADDGQDDPVSALSLALKSSNIDPSEFIVLAHGEAVLGGT